MIWKRLPVIGGLFREGPLTILSQEQEKQQLHALTKEKKKIIEDHKAWLENKNQGKRAKLRGDWSYVDFDGADLTGAELQRANLSYSDLSDVKLDRSDLTLANLFGASIIRTSLRDSKLDSTDLRCKNGPKLAQIARSDLTNAKLPEAIQEIPRLTSVQERLDRFKKAHCSILVLYFFILLSILYLSDASIVVGAAPILLAKQQIPVQIYFIVVPSLIVVLHFYQCHWLDRLWQDVVTLPAVFPCATSIESKMHGWVLTDLVRAFFFQFREDQDFKKRFWIATPIFLWRAAAIFVLWRVSPILLAILWLKFIPRQDMPSTIFHIVVFLIIFIHACFSIHKAQNVIVGRRKVVVGAGIATNVTLVIICLIITTGAVLGVPSGKFKYEKPSSWLPFLSLKLGISPFPFANLRGEEISVGRMSYKMATESAEKLKSVVGASLPGRNLRFADASGAFLAKADLRGSNLKGINLRGSNLHKADLQNANLEGADFANAILVGARLDGANLLGAKNLQSAKLFGACTSGKTILPESLDSLQFKLCK